MALLFPFYKGASKSSSHLLRSQDTQGVRLRLEPLSANMADVHALTWPDSRHQVVIEHPVGRGSAAGVSYNVHLVKELCFWLLSVVDPE